MFMCLKHHTAHKKIHRSLKMALHFLQHIITIKMTPNEHYLLRL